MLWEAALAWRPGSNPRTGPVLKLRGGAQVHPLMNRGANLGVDLAWGPLLPGVHPRIGAFRDER